MPTVNINNAKIFYAHTGDADSPYTLLFIHSTTSAGEYWHVLTSYFSNYNCIAVDLPNHGRSTGKNITSVEEFADFTEYFTQHLQNKGILTKHITLIGHSLGGAISIELAIRKLPYIRRLILLSSGANNSKYCSSIIDNRYHINNDSFNLEHLEPLKWGRKTNEYDKINAQKLSTTSTPTLNSSLYLQDILTTKNYNKLNEINNIDIPTLVIMGDDDQMLPVQTALDMKKHLLHCNVAIIPYRGHLVLFEELDYVKKIISHFFARYKDLEE